MSDIVDLDGHMTPEERLALSRQRGDGGGSDLDSFITWFRERRALGETRGVAPDPAGELAALRQRLADMDSASPDAMKARARADREAALARIQTEEAAALEGVADPAVRSATSAVYAERRAAVDREHLVAMSAAERREGAIATSRESGFRAIAHGVDGRAGGRGLIGREVERRKSEIQDRADVDLAAARAADAEAERWGRHTDHTKAIRERTMRELADVDTWARESGEHWAGEREAERLNDRQARIATGVAEQRVAVMDRIAELERQTAQTNGNGDAA